MKKVPWAEISVRSANVGRLRQGVMLKGLQVGNEGVVTADEDVVGDPRPEKVHLLRGIIDEDLVAKGDEEAEVAKEGEVLPKTGDAEDLLFPPVQSLRVGLVGTQATNHQSPGLFRLENLPRDTKISVL